MKPETDKKYGNIYRDTIDFINLIFQDYDIYGEIFNIIEKGNNSVELKDKQLFKNIDKTWVSVIEDSLISLDTCIRLPRISIKETEEVMPIELSRNITARSIRHLAQHTDYINKIEDDMITPSKILNVFREEDIFTYENKFVNTLVDRLYIFVEKRYSILKDYGADEKSSSLNFTSDMESDRTSAKITFNIEIKNKSGGETKEDGANDSSDLWKRVEALRNVVLGYVNSPFIRSMGKAFIRPPIMRTNAIMKNKDLHKCLELWQFIESYDNIGYEIIVNETLRNPDEEYIKELYSLLALQYVIFKHNTSEIERENAISEFQTDEPLMPRIVTQFEEHEVDEYNVYDVKRQKVLPASHMHGRKRLTEQDIRIREAIDLALAADKKIREDELARIREEELLAERKRLEKIKELERIQKEKERIQREKERAKRHSKKQRIIKKKQKREQDETD